MRASFVPTLPNPMMPEAVRLTHLVETLPYQFLFGWFVAWLFGRGGGPAQPREVRQRDLRAA